MIRLRGGEGDAALYAVAVPGAEHAIGIIKANVTTEGQYLEDLGRVSDEVILSLHLAYGEFKKV